MFLFTPLDECSTFSRALIFISFLCQLSPSFPRRVINTEMPPTHISRHSNSPSLFVSSSLSRSLPHAASSTPQIIAEKPAELHCEFIIIQLGFLHSHILSADGSNCETLSERTDHLCPNQKILSALPLPLKANRWNCSYVHRQLAHSATIYLPYRTHSHAGKYACVSKVCLLLLIFSDSRERDGVVLVKATGTFKGPVFRRVSTEQQQSFGWKSRLCAVAAHSGTKVINFKRANLYESGFIWVSFPTRV